MGYLECKNYCDGYCLTSKSAATGINHECIQRNDCPDAITATLHDRESAKDSFLAFRRGGNNGEKTSNVISRNMKYRKKNEGLPIPVVAILNTGETFFFESLTKAAEEFGVSLQYVHRSCIGDILRPYQCKDQRRWPVRYAFKSNENYKVLAGRNRESYKKYLTNEE